MRCRGVPLELQSLCEELDALGGGDAKVERVEAVCILSKRGNRQVHDNEEKSGPSAAISTSDAVAQQMGTCRAVIRHLGKGKVMVAGQAVGSARCYSMHGFVESSDQEALSNLVAVPVSKLLLTGFNSSVIAHGQSGTGKTTATLSEGGLFWDVLHTVLLEKPKGATLTLSCWEVFGGHVLDLLADQDSSPPLAGQTLRRFVELRVSTMSEARSLLNLCKSRSVNWASGKAEPHPMPNRAHAFVRLDLYSPCGQEGHSCGSVHFVDLVGTHSQVLDTLYTDAKRANIPGRMLRPSEKELEALRHALDQEKSQNLKDNFAISQLVRGNEKGQQAKSNVAKFVEALLLGNGKIFLLAFVGNDPRDVAPTKETMELAQSASERMTACARVKFVHKGQTGFDTIEDAHTYVRRLARRKAEMKRDRKDLAEALRPVDRPLIRKEGWDGAVQREQQLKEEREGRLRRLQQQQRLQQEQQQEQQQQQQQQQRQQEEQQQQQEKGALLSVPTISTMTRHEMVAAAKRKKAEDEQAARHAELESLNRDLVKAKLVKELRRKDFEMELLTEERDRLLHGGVSTKAEAALPKSEEDANFARSSQQRHSLGQSIEMLAIQDEIEGILKDLYASKGEATFVDVDARGAGASSFPLEPLAPSSAQAKANTRSTSASLAKAATQQKEGPLELSRTRAPKPIPKTNASKGEPSPRGTVPVPNERVEYPSQSERERHLLEERLEVLETELALSEKRYETVMSEARDRQAKLQDRIREMQVRDPFSASVFELYEKEIATLRSTVATLEERAARTSDDGDVEDENTSAGDDSDEGNVHTLQAAPKVPNLLDLAAQARRGRHHSGGYSERYSKHRKKRINLRKRLAAMSSSLSRLRKENGELRQATRKSELHQKGYQRSIRQNAKLVEELREKDARVEAMAEEIRRQGVLLGQMQRENSKLIESERNLIQDRLLASNEVLGLRTMAKALERRKRG